MTVPVDANLLLKGLETVDQAAVLLKRLSGERKRLADTLMEIALSRQTPDTAPLIKLAASTLLELYGEDQI